MDDPAIFVGATVASYFLGSIPFGLIIGRRRGVDIRAVGSGNIGATNVARNLGKRVGAAVLLLDAAKGAIPIVVAMHVEPISLAGEYIVTAVGLAAIVGHCFPVWLRFIGGKGVATSLGVFLVVDPKVAALGVVLFAVIYKLTRRASLGSVAAALAFPGLLWAFGRPIPLVHLGMLAAAVVIIKHQSNLRRVLQGRELEV